MSDRISSFLFCDIEGSTALLQEIGTSDYSVVLDQVREAIRSAMSNHGGWEVDTAGDGLFGSFPSAANAVLAAVDAQRALQTKEYPGGRRVSVRMGIHTGESVQTMDGLVGLDVHLAARVCAAARGGQILISLATRTISRDHLPAALKFLNLGEVTLKGLAHPEQVFQVVAEGLRAEFPPLDSADPRRRTNLPGNVPELVGREEAIREVRSALEDGRSRLLTLTGPGGAGKTSLALHVALGFQERFPDGIYFISLVDVSDPALVPEVICHAIDVKATAGGYRDALRTFLDRKRVLLVLDNFEHITEAAGFLGRLLETSPSVVLLVTSRTLLHVRGEREYRVPPLAVPGKKNVATSDLLTEFSATRLFLERATHVHPSFEPGEEDAEAIAEICRRLDGLPLAIELAAARIKLFTPSTLLSRLEAQSDLLRSSRSGVHERHLTIKKTIDWSYGLLTEREQRLFCHLAVFRGGWTLEAAEQIGGEDVLDLLSALIDKSLVRREDTGSGVRFSMLEVIHEYAKNRLLESGRSDDVAREHARHYLSVAEDAEPHLTGPDQRRWLDRLTLEHENFSAVFRWVTENGEAETGLRLGAALWRFWVVRGFMIEGDRTLRTILGLSGAAGLTRERARALNGLGTIIHELHNFSTARPPLEESLAIWRTLGDSAGIATTLNSLGWIAMFESDYDRCEQQSREAMQLHRMTGNERGVAVSLNNLGWAALNRNQLKDALRCFDESRSIREGLGDERGVAFLQTNTGWVLFRSGRHDEGRVMIERALKTLTVLDDQQLRSWTLSTLGNLWEDLGEYDKAVRLVGESVAIMTEVGNLWTVFFEQCCLARALHHSGEPEKAKDLLEFLKSEVLSTGSLWVRGIVAYELGSVSLRTGDRGRAAVLFRESLEIRDSVSDSYGAAHCLVGYAEIAAARGEMPLAGSLSRSAIALSARTGGHLPHWEYSIAEKILSDPAGGKAEPIPPSRHSEVHSLVADL